MTRVQALTRLVVSCRSSSRLLSGGATRSNSSEAHELSSEVDPTSSSFHHIPSLKGAADRERVAYKHEAIGISQERRTYFSREEGGGGTGAWGFSGVDGEEGTSIPGLEPGRVVECRRSGLSVIGLILAAVVSNGRPRLIVLRSSGEIWPLSPKDVQFVMPPSLITASTAQRCWNPDMLVTWAQGEEAFQNEAADSDMMAARREAAVTLRRVGKETEKMVGRLSIGRGVEGAWAECVLGKDEEERGAITSAQAADLLLYSGAGQTGPSRSKTKNNTLPAYAAHTILMSRPDLFVADDGDMWESGVFLVRSKAERARIDTVTRWTNGTTPEDKAVVQSFVSKCHKALASSPSSPSSTAPTIDWSPSDKLLISTLFQRIYETRTTQHSPSDRLSIAIIRAVDPYPGAIADQATIARLLIELGCLPTTDSLYTSKCVEAELRDMQLAAPSTPVTRSTPLVGELYDGTELDSLREDYSSHTVWVIDDPTAKELDDGISLVPVPGSEDVWVHVHIADPTRILPIDHPLAVRASYRGTALYMPEGNTPLIPRGLENLEMMQELSLGSADGAGGQSVMTFSARLSPNGAIEETAVKLGWIKSPRLTTYGDVDEAFGIARADPIRPFGSIAFSSETPTSGHTRGPLSPAEIPQLELLRNLASTRRAYRLRNAGMDMTLPLGSPFLVSPSTPNHNIFSPTSTPSHSAPFPDFPIIDYTVPPLRSHHITASTAVAEMMMLAGKVAASYCSANSIPVPYRGARAPEQVHVPGQVGPTLSIDDLLAMRQTDGHIDPFGGWASRMMFWPSSASSEPLEHWTMGFVGEDAGYIRPTSPLRRFDDFLVHSQIKSHIAKQKGVAWGRQLKTDEVEELTHRIKRSQNRAKRAMKNADAFWQAGLFAQRLQHPRYASGEGEVDLREPLLARVAGPSTAMRGLTTTPVYVPALGASIRMTSADKWDIGEEVKVRVESAVQWPAPVIASVQV